MTNNTTAARYVAHLYGPATWAFLDRLFADATTARADAELAAARYQDAGADYLVQMRILNVATSAMRAAEARYTRACRVIDAAIAARR